MNISQIDMGQVKYQFRKPLKIEYVEDDNSRIVALSDIPNLSGLGDTPKKARRDLECKLHELFQNLYGLEPFELDESQRATWDFICKHVDVRAYFDNNPTIQHRIGRIEEANPGKPRKIRWINGEEEYIRLEQAPPEFARYSASRGIECYVKTNNPNGKPVTILVIVRDFDWKDVEMTPEEAKKSWNSFSTTTQNRGNAK